MLKVWNMLLVILAFWLSLFGTFLTRSGILELDPLVHRELDRAVVPRLHLLVVAGSLALVFRRLPLLRSKTRLESLVSREATFLYNNLLLVALCLTILWGVTFPLLSEAVHGERGASGQAVLQLLPARLRAAAAAPDGDRAARRVAARVAALARRDVRVAGGDRAGRRGGPARARRGLVVPGLLAYTFSAFVLGSIGSSSCAARGRGARSRASLPRAFSSLVGETAAATAATSCTPRSSCWRSASPARARTTRSEGGSSPGESARGGGYTLTYLGTRSGMSANASEMRARVDVQRDGAASGSSSPGRTSTRSSSRCRTRWGSAATF